MIQSMSVDDRHAQAEDTKIDEISMKVVVYLLLVYLVMALVPSETACLASSPGRRRQTGCVLHV